MEKKVVRYRMACGGTTAVLASEVQGFLNMGYQPYGQPFIREGDPGEKSKYIRDECLIYQAMVLYADNNPDEKEQS